MCDLKRMDKEGVNIKVCDRCNEHTALTEDHNTALDLNNVNIGRNKYLNYKH